MRRNPESGQTRRDFLVRGGVVIAGTALGCGDDAASAPDGGTTVPGRDGGTIPGADGAAPDAGPSSTDDLTTLTLHPSESGAMPYLATLYPLEGHVPADRVLVSPDDTNLRSSVLSRWPDGSASVVVIAGETEVSSGTSKAIRLRYGPAVGTALGPARVAELVTSIACDFGSVGSAMLTDFASPDRVWWANESTICARYRLAIGGEMEAIVDVHAFRGGRAFVEVVIENGKVDAGASSVSAPSTKTYSGATVSVNGTTIATVSSPGGGAPRSRLGASYDGGHEAFRAWYASHWVGGDPGLEVTHDAAYLQAHPWFYRALEATDKDLESFYSERYDTYEPWATCRLRVPGMSSGGDDEQIAFLTEEQGDYVHSGDRAARRAVIATGLAFHSLNFHWRHAGGGPFDGEVPARSQLLGKSSDDGGEGTWPRIESEPRYGGGTFDGSHIPATTLVAFLCRPSPCFIEIAQKELAWNHTNYASTDGWHGFDQIRSRAWRVRNYGMATFLTPDADADRKAGYREVLALNARMNLEFFDKPWNTLGVMWAYGPDEPTDYGPETNEYWIAAFMVRFCCMAWDAVDRAKVLQGEGSDDFTRMADTSAAMPVRIVNEAMGGEWRKQGIEMYIGEYQRDSGTLAMPADHGEAARFGMTGALPPVNGTWLDPSSRDWDSLGDTPWIPYGYEAQFFYTLCIAVERGVPGAEEAWQKVYTDGGISNFADWRTRLRGSPRFNRFPRNKSDTKR
jgi:hypothetical protein